MILSPLDAQLVLILIGQSPVSAIRPGNHTAEETLKLVQRLKDQAGRE